MEHYSACILGTHIEAKATNSVSNGNYIGTIKINNHLHMATAIHPIHGEETFTEMSEMKASLRAVRWLVCMTLFYNLPLDNMAYVIERE